MDSINAPHRSAPKNIKQPYPPTESHSRPFKKTKTKKNNHNQKETSFGDK